MCTLPVVYRMPCGRKVALKIAYSDSLEEEMLCNEAKHTWLCKICGTRAFLSFSWLAICVHSAAATAWAPLYFLGDHYNQVWGRMFAAGCHVSIASVYQLALMSIA